MRAIELFTNLIYETWMRDIQGEKIIGILKKVTPEKNVLDIGCGPGFLEKFIKGSFSVDIDLENLKKVRGSKFKVLADGSRLPFKDKSFKTIFCIDTLHLLNAGKISKEIERVLSSGEAIVSMFCNEYTKSERLSELKSQFKNFDIKKEFFIGKEETDAVIVIQKNNAAVV